MNMQTYRFLTVDEAGRVHDYECREAKTDDAALVQSQLLATTLHSVEVWKDGKFIAKVPRRASRMAATIPGGAN